MSERTRWTIPWGRAMRLECWADHDTQRAYNGDLSWDDVADAWSNAAAAWNECQRIIGNTLPEKRDAAYIHQVDCDAAREHACLMALRDVCRLAAG